MPRRRRRREPTRLVSFQLGATPWRELSRHDIGTRRRAGRAEREPRSIVDRSTTFALPQARRGAPRCASAMVDRMGYDVAIYWACPVRASAASSISATFIIEINYCQYKELEGNEGFASDDEALPAYGSVSSRYYASDFHARKVRRALASFAFRLDYIIDDISIDRTIEETAPSEEEMMVFKARS